MLISLSNFYQSLLEARTRVSEVSDNANLEANFKNLAANSSLSPLYYGE